MVESASSTAPYAIIETGGKQYRVSVGDRLAVEKLDAEPGSDIVFDRVLLVGGNGSTAVGTPLVSGATVSAQVEDQFRGEKIIVFMAVGIRPNVGIAKDHSIYPKIDGVVCFEPVTRAKRRISVYPPDVYPVGGNNGLLKPAYESVAFMESAAAAD